MTCSGVSFFLYALVYTAGEVRDTGLKCREKVAWNIMTDGIELCSGGDCIAIERLVVVGRKSKDEAMIASIDFDTFEGNAAPVRIVGAVEYMSAL